MKKTVRSFLQLIPVVISFVLLAAHFLRSGNLLFVALSLAFIGLLFVRHPIMARFLQVILMLAAVEWFYTTYVFATIRIENGMPWVRLVIILGGVALFTLASAGVFILKTQKERYNLK